ncbi:zinc finger protein 660-like [Diaphorina citri]|uniref:Zinc finger protein 660-like n=1 Tax=Diaphorina citri TaxID=121845 RepID=A0A3Q0JJT5_DIACI|nr:zinc finger protein 660-like [Diaphorina citri]
MRVHLRIHTDFLQCSYCRAILRCDSRDEILDHCKLCRDIPRVKNLTYLTCKHCLISLESTSNLLIEHSKECEGTWRPDKNFKYVCFACDYHSYSNHNMIKHFHVHTGEKPYKCPYCEHRSRDVSNLKLHIRTHYKNIKF